MKTTTSMNLDGSAELAAFFAAANARHLNLREEMALAFTDASMEQPVEQNELQQHTNFTNNILTSK